MKQKHLAVVLASAAALAQFSLVAQAADFTWSNLTGGAQAWDSAANWDGVAFPNAVDDGADLAVNLAAGLTANIPAGGVTIGRLSLGGTGSAVATTIAGGTLTFDIGTAPALINSVGFAGSTNAISAPIVLADNLDIGTLSTNTLTLSGVINPIGAARTITNRMVGGGQVILSGGVNLHDPTDPSIAWDMGFGGVAGAVYVHNGSFTSSTGGTGGPNLSGDVANNGALYTTHYLNVASPNLGAAYITRGTVVVGNDLAFGTAVISMNAGHRTHLQSDNPARTLSNNIAISNGFTVDGNNSLTLNGWIVQGNNRAMTNNLAPGSTLTMTGSGNGVSIYIFESTDPGNRTFILDGRGNTVVQGQIKNDDGPDNTGAYNLTKRGSGTLTLTNTTSTWAGATNANGGLLVFDAANTWGATSGINVNANGGVWYTPGSADANFGSFVAKLATTSTGALAIPSTEAASNFDFSASGSLASVASMSIGVQGAVSYTGTVTPGGAGYFWGGMTGTLTLNGNDRMTGGNAVTYRNGGAVIVTGTQSYTGVTTISGANLTTGQNRADLRNSDRSSDTENIFTTTVLEISSIANGGANSPLGASSNAAANLVFTGGTLRYMGAAGSTDRLFSLGTFGGTIESSGTGPLTFTNAGAVTAFGNGNRSLTLSGSNGGDNSVAATLADADTGAGSLLSVVKNGTGKWILSGANTHTGGTTVNAGLLVAENYNNGTLNVGASGVARVSQKGTANSAAGTTKLLDTQVVLAGQLDLTNNSMVVDYTGGPNPTLVDTYRQHLLAGRIGTTASTPAGTKIGYADNAAFGTPLATFGGVAVDTDSLLLKFTYAGDSNLDGQVDITDLAALATAWQTSGVWVNGDFDYSGFIDITDLAALATNWQAGVGAPLAQSFEQALASVGLAGKVVPEPATLSLIGVGAMALMGRRRRS